MKRAQGILKHWQRFKDERNYINLSDFIDYHYREYCIICNRCSEKALSKSKWLTQEIVVDEP